ncbi:MAG: ATP-dependent DNA ligase [Acidimicrobiia bacterium]|nr:ATP-dependent DNA ligase [Acidimicrobiia bacterium]
MDLPFGPPVQPMLAKATHEVPAGEGLVYEPKWDGFRCIVFRDGDEVHLGSRNERPLTRYFPEILDPLRASLPERCVVDGELVLVTPDGLDFEALQQRIHPADSRVARLAEETPVSYVAFDLLALGETDLRSRPFADRRRKLEESVQSGGQVYVSPVTGDPEVARRWFIELEGAGLDGVVAKDAGGAYAENKRLWTKVKHVRTADCVVAGWRPHKQGGVGSLLLGLYDGSGALHHVGIASSFSAARREQLEDEIRPAALAAGDDHPWRHWGDMGEWDGTRMPGGMSRWSAGRDLSWVPLRPERVVEVRYEHMQGMRFRHTARFVRWRPDRDPESCTYEQLEAPPPFDLTRLLGPAGHARVTHPD